MNYDSFKKIICQNFAEGRCREQGINIPFLNVLENWGNLGKLLLSQQEQTQSPNLKKKSILFMYIFPLVS